ncbi:MAG: glycosyltransferase family 9 protein [Chthoniobacterales bacterium]
MKTPSSICLVRLSALGDVVLALPLVQTLRRAFPAAQITWVTSPESAALLRGLAGVNFLVVPKPRGLRDYARFRRRVAGEKFDVVLAAQASHRANVLQALIPARRRIGFDQERARDFHDWFVREHVRPRKEHLLEGFLAFAEALGIPPEQHVIEWPLVLDEAPPELPVKPFVAIHLAASKPERNWRLERHAAVSRQIVNELGLGVVLTGSPSETEREMANEVTKQAGVSITNLVGRTTPKQLALVLRNARAVISPDTAAVHLARAVGTPIVGLYAVARPEMTGPYRALDFCVNAFPTAVRKILGKDPETCAWNTRVPFLEAMDLIGVDEVIDQLHRALAAHRTAP